jgi:hypothetical protein
MKKCGISDMLGKASLFRSIPKVNVITCLPNGEERSVSFLNEEEVVTAVARELGNGNELGAP